MGPIASSAELLDILRQYRLLEPAQLGDVQTQLRHFGDARRLARELAQRGWLTPYQVNELILGRGQHLVLGSYILLERLGEGGMGTVFKARQRSLGRIVAVKVIRDDRLANAQAVKRFHREIRAAAQLDHPNIVRAFDADDVGGTHLLVMEFVDNSIDLSQVVKRHGPLPVREACDYIRQAALGLEHAHQRGLVHRDIKPQNLLLATPPNPPIGSPPIAVVKILDMGLARLDREDDHEATSTLTQEGTVMGTLDYIAPEQARDSHSVDIRGDLYSLGCAFFYLLAGRVVFPGGTAAEKLLKHQLEPPPLVRALRADAPPEVAMIVARLLAKRPEERFQTPGELAKALEDLLAGKALTMIRPAPRPAQDSATIVDPRLARQWAAVVDPQSQTDALVKPRPQLRPATAATNRQRWLIIGGAAALLLTLLLWQPWRSRAPTPDANASARRKPRRLTEQELAAQAEQNRQADERKRAAAAEEALKPLAERARATPFGSSETGAALRKDLREFLMKHSATPAATQACDLLGQVLAKVPSPLDELDPAKLPQDCLDYWRAPGGSRRCPG